MRRVPRDAVRLVEAVLALPVVSHAVSAVQRFLERFGIQFAAAITYFSVLSIVPILMVAFAAVGLTLTLFLPAVTDLVRSWLTSTLQLDADSVLGDQVVAIIDQAFHSWQTVGLIGLGAAAWAGAKWVMHLQIGIRAQLRPTFDVAQDKASFLGQLGRELALLFGLFLLVVLTLLSSALATRLQSAAVRLTELMGLPAPALTSVALSLLVTASGGFALFWFLFTTMPEQAVPKNVRIQGASIGAVGLLGLEYGAGILLGVFADNLAVTVFGTVIVLMLFLNLFASLVLIVAAWIATHRDYVAAARASASPAEDPGRPPEEPTGAE